VTQSDVISKLDPQSLLTYVTYLIIIRRYVITTGAELAFAECHHVTGSLEIYYIRYLWLSPDLRYFIKYFS